MTAYDALLMSRTTGNLTTTESGSGIEIRGTPLGGMAARVSVPTAFNDDDTLLIKVYDSADNSSFALISQSQTEDTFKTNPRDIIVPVVTPKKYVKIQLIPSSTTAANINFGAVNAGIVLGVGHNWSRAVSFE